MFGLDMLVIMQSIFGVLQWETDDDEVTSTIKV